MRLKYFGLSVVGKVRGHNEDVWAALPEAGLFVLADGMGGHPAGDLAARLAVDAVCASADTGPHTAVAAANRAVLERAHSDEDLKGMGSTLCVLHIRGDRASYAHIGDSRIYRRVAGTAESLTVDHSIWSQTKEGKLVRRLTQAIGVAAQLEPSVGSFVLEPPERLLLCSDGLTDVVEPEELDRIFCADRPISEVAERLVEAGMHAGAPDNITVLLVEVSGE